VRIRERGPARVAAEALGFADRFYGPIGFAVATVLDVFVFAPRGMEGAVIAGAVGGSAILLAWMAGQLL